MFYQHLNQVVRHENIYIIIFFLSSHQPPSPSFTPRRWEYGADIQRNHLQGESGRDTLLRGTAGLPRQWRHLYRDSGRNTWRWAWTGWETGNSSTAWEPMPDSISPTATASSTGRFTSDRNMFTPVLGMDGYLGIDYRLEDAPMSFGIQLPALYGDLPETAFRNQPVGFWISCKIQILIK